MNLFVKFNMDIFSLEDNGNELFITQKPSVCMISDEKSDDEGGLFCGVDMTDFQSPCVSMRQNALKSEMYSDISDDEDNFSDPNKK